MLKGLSDAFREAMQDTDRERALELVRGALARGISAKELLFDVLSNAIEATLRDSGERFDANVAQYFMASQIAADVADELLGELGPAGASRGKIVIGNASRDFHALGKRIVVGCLLAHGFEVTDLGVNVAPERFVDEAVARGAQVIGISTMMVHTAKGENACRGVRRILRERGLEAQLKIAVGGAPYRFNPELYLQVGADGWAENGVLAVELMERLVHEVTG